MRAFFIGTTKASFPYRHDQSARVKAADGVHIDGGIIYRLFGSGAEDRGRGLAPGSVCVCVGGGGGGAVGGRVSLSKLCSENQSTLLTDVNI